MSAAAFRLAVPVLGVLLLAAAPAGACDLTLNGLKDIAFSGTYDAFAGAVPPQAVRFTVKNRGPHCQFAIGVNQGATGGRRMAGPGIGTLRYDILGASNRTVLDAPAPAADGLVVGHTRTDQSQEVYATIPASQTVSAGAYSDQLTFNIYELVDGQPGRLHDTQTVAVRASVGSSIRSTLIVGGVQGSLAGRVATLDFGELRTGQSLPFELQIDGNTPYQVTLASENLGRLAGTDTVNRESRIAYTVTMDGRGATLASPLTMPVVAPSDYGRSSNAHAFQVQIGDISQAIAGRYADNITVTVSAN